MTDQTFSPESAQTRAGSDDFKIVAVSSIGTVFEWFDFFLYGSLAVILSRHFFANVDPSSAFILALLAFAAGYVARPFGALIFGSLGDRVGRKKTFLITLILMGIATFSVGLLPTYAQIGAAAPWILVTMRVMQGLSVGGVYGGAATYIAEHVPQDKRGFYTSWLQITATFSMALSLVVILTTRTIMGESEFTAWGWRIPFLLSSVLLAATIWIQTRLSESPVYLRMKASGQHSAHPWKDAFGNWANLKLVLVALFGAMVGQGVVWYCAQFYALFFVERILKVDGTTTNILLAIALLISTPLYVVFGWLSDKIGRRKVIVAACLGAALFYFPLFKALATAANPDLAHAIATAPITVVADPKECSLQFDPVGGATFSTSCDIARAYLARSGVNYSTIDAPAGSTAQLKIGDQTLDSFHGDTLPAGELKARRADWEKEAGALVKAAGYPTSADPAKINKPMVIVILVAIMVFAAMVYGPMAALLVEMFPARIRYTSMSLPYHLGTGWFGGFVPALSFAIVAATGNIFSGLWYTVGLSALCFIVGVLFLPETKDEDIRR